MAVDLISRKGEGVHTMPVQNVDRIQTIGIVGAGAMGRGIAQIAAAAGVEVLLYDANAEATLAATGQICAMFDKLESKGKMSEAEVANAKSCLKAVGELSDMARCELVIEAVVERIDVKQGIFKALEATVDESCILATNTSSLSVTEIAQVCTHPERFVGFHFFNPVPLMKIAEVIEGIRTSPAVSDALVSFTHKIGHTPVRTKDMPGFIVNHAGRAMNTEGLKVLGEGVASPQQIDAIMREQAGFKLGPFELLDLTGLDVSQPVMEAIYHQFYEEPRFRPSPIAKARLAGGLLGRKSGDGFYTYVDGKQSTSNEISKLGALPAKVWISKRHPSAAQRVLELIKQTSVMIDDTDQPDDESLILLTPFGTDATTAAVEEGVDATRVIAIDALFSFSTGKRVTLMTTPVTRESTRSQAHALFGSSGSPVTIIRDSTGFVAQRIVAMIVNTGCDIAQQEIATPADIDLAVKLGLAYPMGPFELGDHIGAKVILKILKNIHQSSGDPRYRPSPWLTRRALLEISLKTEELKIN
jgi:3-hydroxybutyryl-CoA dehydrogenase